MASTIQPEMRLDINGDGLPYTEAEFKEHYNGPKEWINSPMAKFDEAKGIWVAVVKTISDDSNMDGAASGTTHIDQLAQKDESSDTTIRDDDVKRLEAIKAAKPSKAIKARNQITPSKQSKQAIEASKRCKQSKSKRAM